MAHYSDEELTVNGHKIVCHCRYGLVFAISDGRNNRIPLSRKIEEAMAWAGFVDAYEHDIERMRQPLSEKEKRSMRLRNKYYDFLKKIERGEDVHGYLIESYSWDRLNTGINHTIVFDTERGAQWFIDEYGVEKARPVLITNRADLDAIDHWLLRGQEAEMSYRFGM